MWVWLIGAGKWLAGSKAGRMVALIAGVALALLMARRSGRKAAQVEMEADRARETGDRVRRARDAAEEMHEDLRDDDHDDRIRKLRERGLQ